jgi:hypothetical protein
MVVTASLISTRVFVDRATRQAAFRDDAQGGWAPIFAASLGPWHIRARSARESRQQRPGHSARAGRSIPGHLGSVSFGQWRPAA